MLYPPLTIPTDDDDLRRLKIRYWASFSIEGTRFTLLKCQYFSFTVFKKKKKLLLNFLTVCEKWMYIIL